MKHFPEQPTNHLKRFIAQYQGDIVEKFFENNSAEIENLKKDFDTTIKQDKHAYDNDARKAPILFILLQKLTFNELIRLKTSFETPENKLDNRLMVTRLADYLEPINMDAANTFRRISETIPQRGPQ